MKIVVYSAITGGKDLPREDILCFTDYDKFTVPVLNAKIYKVLAHQYVDADISIWIDGNIKLLVEPEELIKEFLGDADLAVWKHFERECIYDEAEKVEQYPFVKEQITHYKTKGYPKQNGLGECNVIIRRHTKTVEAFNNAWWSEICVWSQRDQLSFPVVASRFPNLKVKFYDGNVREHEMFKFKGHKIK